MRNLLDKINLNRTRTIYFLATFVMIIGCYALNKSYSMFVQNESKKAVGATVPIMTSDLSVNSVTLNANQEMLVKQTITNTGSTAINYGINTSGSNYTAKLTSDSDTAVTGTLNSSANKVLYFYLKNNSSSSNKVSFTLNKNYTTVATKKPTSNISTSSKYSVTKTSYAIPYSNEPNTLKYKILYNFVNSSIYTGSKPSTTSTTAATEFNSRKAYISNNKGKSSTTATTTLQFTTTSAGKLNFDYFVSSESANYDYLTITLQKDSGNAETILDKTGGENKSGSISKDLVSGSTYKLTFNYRKDGSVDKYDDLAYIENLDITATLNSSGITNPSNGTYKFVQTTPNKISLPITSGSATFQSPTSFTAVETAEKGLYQAEDDYGTTYYFRGASTKNYVSFADKTWRIVRINGDGTVRLILDDVAKYSSGTVIKTAFNTNYNDNAYVGYMYGTLGSTTYDATHENIYDSTIKKAVDKWYEDNLKTNYANFLADTLFCNDKTLASNGIGGVTTQLGYGTNKTYYASTERLLYSTGTTSITTAKPTFKCAESATNDYSRFTVNVTTLANGNKTNGKLTYSIGLLSADEVSYAGAYKYNQTNKTYYLYNSSITSYWWLSSPYIYNSSHANEWNVYCSGGSIVSNYVNSSYAFRPSINLKASVLVNGGEGTSSNPYTITY